MDPTLSGHAAKEGRQQGPGAANSPRPASADRNGPLTAVQDPLTSAAILLLDSWRGDGREHHPRRSISRSDRHGDMRGPGSASSLLERGKAVVSRGPSASASGSSFSASSGVRSRLGAALVHQVRLRTTMLATVLKWLAMAALVHFIAVPIAQEVGLRSANSICTCTYTRIAGIDGFFPCDDA